MHTPPRAPWRAFLLLVTATLVTLLRSAPAVHAQSYTFTDLGALVESDPFSAGTGVNNKGQVIGYANISGNPNPQAFLYSGGHVTDLGMLPGDVYSYGLGINAAGQATGFSGKYVGMNGTIKEHAFLYSQDAMTDLGTLPGYPNSDGNGINDSGQVTGVAFSSDSSRYRAFLYSAALMTDLGALPGYSYSDGTSINSSGQITGQSAKSDNMTYHAFLYSSGEMTDLGTLPGYPNSVGNGINDSGQVAGSAYTFDNSMYHAFLYSGGQIIDLGALPGYPNTSSAGINNGGQVVGVAGTGEGDERAFLYSGGHMTDLNSLIDPASGWTLKAAYAITDTGFITGFSANAQQQYHAYLLSPVLGPVLTSLSPSSKAAGSSAFTLVVNGTGFAANSIVSWDGSALATTYVSSMQLTAFVSASRLHTAGVFPVTVATPGAATSNSKPFTLTAPLRTVASLSLSPASVKGGKPGTGTITLSGPAPSGGLAVKQTSSDTSAATLSPILNIAAGATTAKFKITTYAVSSAKSVTLTSSVNGTGKTALLTVTP